MRIAKLHYEGFAKGMITFGEFLKREINTRNMSLSEFARLVGVSHQTISKYMEYPNPETSYPSFEFLVKLSQATYTDLGTLASIVEPSGSHINPEILALAEKIHRLDADGRNAIDALVMGLAVQNKQEEF